jgi:hypothetical protein
MVWHRTRVERLRVSQDAVRVLLEDPGGWKTIVSNRNMCEMYQIATQAYFDHRSAWFNVAGAGGNEIFEVASDWIDWP